MTLSFSSRGPISVSAANAGSALPATPAATVEPAASKEMPGCRGQCPAHAIAQSTNRVRACSLAFVRSASVWIGVIFSAGGLAMGQTPVGGPGVLVGPRPAAIPFAPPPLPPQAANEGTADPVATAVAYAPDASDSSAAGLSKRLVEVEKFVKREEDKRKAEEQKKKELETEGYEVGTDLNFKTFWKDGFVAETANKDFRVHFGGRLHTDAAWFAPGANLEPLTGPAGWQDGADFRRLRLRGDGTMYEVFEWVVEIDFQTALAGTTNHPVPTDTYLSMTHLPLLGACTLGHFKEPFSFDEYGTHDNYTLLMERSLAENAFDPARNIGVMFNNTALDDTLIWATGVFRGSSDNNSGDAFDYGDGEYAFTSRLVAMPYYADEGRYWCLFGGAYSHRSFNPSDAGINGANASRARFAARMPIRVNSPFLVDTTSLVANDDDLFNVQMAMNLGPFMFQSEYFHADVHDVRRGAVALGVPRLLNASFNGWYAQASYFLTDEFHPIERDRARLARARPHEQFFLVRRGDEEGFAHGSGAWEVVARYDYLDAASPALNAFPATPGVPGSAAAAVATAGHEKAITVGLNWYLSPNARVMWNYSHALREVADPAGSGNVDAFAMRVLFDF